MEYFSRFTRSPPEWEIVVHVFVEEICNTGYHYSLHEKYRRFPSKRYQNVNTDTADR